MAVTDLGMSLGLFTVPNCLKTDLLIEQDHGSHKFIGERTKINQRSQPLP